MNSIRMSVALVYTLYGCFGVNTKFGRTKTIFLFDIARVDMDGPCFATGFGCDFALNKLTRHIAFSMKTLYIYI